MQEVVLHDVAGLITYHTNQRQEASQHLGTLSQPSLRPLTPAKGDHLPSTHIPLERPANGESQMSRTCPVPSSDAANHRG